MEENVIQISGGITINVDVSVKNAMYVEKYIFGILLHVVAKMENIYQVLWMIQCLRVMKLLTWILSHTTKKQKQFQQILSKKSSLQNIKFLYFTYIFINYYSIIDSC